MSPHQNPVQSVAPAPAADAARAAAPAADAVSPAAAARPLSGGSADLGATTVEYAIVVLAAAAFGGVMAAVLASGQVQELLMGLITKALSA
jgi:hypothetical protein